jgi:hypothetical protein
MSHFPDHTRQAERLFAGLGAEFARAKPALDRARSKLFALTGPRGEGYQVDLGKTLFEVIVAGRAIASGPLQVIGTYLQTEGTWLWSWENPSIPKQAWADMAKFARERPELEGIRQCVKFAATEEFCEPLAQWMATTAGWTGAYPGEYNQALVYLAVRPSLHDTDGKPCKELWCSMCGRRSSEVLKLIVADEGAAGICSVCAGTLQEIAATLPDGPATHDITPVCIMCGTSEGHRVCTDYSLVCAACIRSAR